MCFYIYMCVCFYFAFQKKKVKTQESFKVLSWFQKVCNLPFEKVLPLTLLLLLWIIIISYLK